MSSSKSPTIPKATFSYDYRQQSAEDRYGSPENFLEVEVRDPRIQGESSNKYVDYELVCRVPCGRGCNCNRC